MEQTYDTIHAFSSPSFMETSSHSRDHSRSENPENDEFGHYRRVAAEAVSIISAVAERPTIPGDETSTTETSFTLDDICFKITRDRSNQENPEIVEIAIRPNQRPAPGEPLDRLEDRNQTITLRFIGGGDLSYVGRNGHRHNLDNNQLLREQVSTAIRHAMHAVENWVKMRQEEARNFSYRYEPLRLFYEKFRTD